MDDQPQTAPDWRPWRSECCEGEKCKCGWPAVAKVEEVIFHDDPVPARHPLTTYLCRDCFSLLMGRHGVALVDQMRKAAR